MYNTSSVKGSRYRALTFQCWIILMDIGMHNMVKLNHTLSANTISCHLYPSHIILYKQDVDIFRKKNIFKIKMRRLFKILELLVLFLKDSGVCEKSECQLES